MYATEPIQIYVIIGFFMLILLMIFIIAGWEVIKKAFYNIGLYEELRTYTNMTHEEIIEEIEDETR